MNTLVSRAFMQLIASEPSTAGVDGLFVAKAIEVRQGFVRGTVAAWSNDQTDFGPGREVEFLVRLQDAAFERCCDELAHGPVLCL